MNRLLALFGIALLAPLSGAAQTNVVATTPPAAAIRYNLNNLRPVGMAQYEVKAVGALRQYMRFQNEQGSHFIIYEEVSVAPPLREIAPLRQAMIDSDGVFSMEIECPTKAFCTGDCQHMYYETTNAPPTPGVNITNDRNRCAILSFTYEKTTAVNRTLASPGFAAPTSAAPVAPPPAVVAAPPAAIAGPSPAVDPAVAAQAAAAAGIALPASPAAPGAPGAPPNPPGLNIEE